MSRRNISSSRRRVDDGSARLWYGVATLSDTNYYVTTGSPSGIPGATTLHVQAWVNIQTQAVASFSKIIVSNTDLSVPAHGWQIFTTATNSTIVASVDNGAGTQILSSAHTITAGEVGFWHHVAFVYDGANLYLYWDGAAVGSPVVNASYNVSIGPTYIGRRATAGNPATSIAVAGVAGGNTAPSAAEIAAAYSSGFSQKDIVAVPSKTDHFWSVKQDQVGLVPSTITDRAGSNNMTKNGTPTLVSSSS